jgi:phasin
MDSSSSLSGSSAYLESLMRAGQLTMKRFDDALARTMGARGNHPTLGRWGNGRVDDSRRPANARIPPGDLRTMAAAMPDCRLVVMPGIGHSMNLELPALYAGYFGAWFGGLPKLSIGFVLQMEELAMSDTNLSADKIRTMLAEANGRLRKASAEYFDLLEKGLSSSQLPVADQAKQYCGYLQRNVTATFDLGDKLIQAKDMQEAAKVQSEFFQDQMRSLTDHAKSLGESAMKAATSAFTPKS